MLKTNKLKLSIDKSIFDMKFIVNELTFANYNKLNNSKIIDEIGLSNRVVSVCWRGASIYILSEAEQAQNVKSEISRIDTNRSYEKLTEERPSVVYRKRPDIIAQLLINALTSSVNFPGGKAVLLSGKSLYNNAAWKDKDARKEKICSFLTFHVDKDMYLDMKVETYSKLLENDLDKKGNKYSFYEIGDDMIPYRTYRYRKNETYVKKRFDNGKANINFLNLENKTLFMQSKIGLLNLMLDKFKKRWAGMASIDFHHIDTMPSPEYMNQELKSFKQKYRKNNQKWIDSLDGINVVDLVNNDKSEILKKTIIDVLDTKYNIKTVNQYDNVPKIQIIHEKGWYKDTNSLDPHQDSTSNAIQHITIEAAMLRDAPVRNISSIIEGCINNLIIKNDIIHGKINVIDWNSFIGADMSFGCIFNSNTTNDKKTATKMAVIMDVDKNGNFNFRTTIPDISANTECRIISLLAEYQDEDFVCVIQMDDSFMIIKETKMYTLPEFHKINEELLNNENSPAKNKISRCKTTRETMYKAIVDINLMIPEPYSNNRCYNVGILGYGMNSVVQKASHVRQISLLEGTDFSEQIIKLLPIGQIRNGQMTVYPFPMKYINEFMLSKRENSCL